MAHKNEELSEAKRHVAPGAVAGALGAYGLKKKMLRGGAGGALLGGAYGYYKGQKKKEEKEKMEKEATVLGSKIARLMNGFSDR